MKNTKLRIPSSNIILLLSNSNIACVFNKLLFLQSTIFFTFHLLTFFLLYIQQDIIVFVAVSLLVIMNNGNTALASPGNRHHISSSSSSPEENVTDKLILQGRNVISKAVVSIWMFYTIYLYIVREINAV